MSGCYLLKLEKTDRTWDEKVTNIPFSIRHDWLLLVRYLRSKQRPGFS